MVLHELVKAGHILRVPDSNDARRDFVVLVPHEAGFANEEVNRFARFLGLGVVASGPFASRGQDELGIAIATARNGSPYLRSNASSIPFRSETAIELTYPHTSRPGSRCSPTCST